jgi:SpoVK/Ycf46/Vps4 family AAA+-type ATPase
MAITETVTTPLAWEDLVLDQAAREQVEMIVRWAQHRETLLKDWQMTRWLPRGYRVLFHGPAGTGKTTTAALLGKALGLAVRRVDLAQLLAKWDEVALDGLFKDAAARDCILFLGEADAVFGRQASTRTQAGYLLQRIEDFPGIAILATNLRSAMDEAFVRRFQSAILFQLPDAEQRYRLWRGMFPAGPVKADPQIDFQEVAAAYELSAGNIANVLRHAALMAAARHPPAVMLADIERFVQGELRKNAVENL